MVRQRHPFGAASRETHRVSPAYFGDPSNTLYSSQSDMEPTNAVDTGAGSVTDGSIVDGGLDGSTAIKPGTLPGAALDTTPPPAPVLESPLESLPAQRSDGTLVVGITGVASYVVPDPLLWDLIDLSGFLVQSTRKPLEGTNPPEPDWSVVTEFTATTEDSTGQTPTNLVQLGVAPATEYWWRVFALDFIGNRSVPSNVVSVTTADDVVPPQQPQSVHTAGGMHAIAVRWDPIPDTDLSHYEVEYRLDGDATWTRITTGGTLVVIAGLTNDAIYNVRVRSVDTSGNTMIPTAGDPPWTNADAETDPDAGWVDGADAVPTSIPGSELIWTEADIQQVFAGQIVADWITSGSLRAGHAPKICYTESGSAYLCDDPEKKPITPSEEVLVSVWNSAGKMVGQWGVGGIVLVDGGAGGEAGDDPLLRPPKYRMLINESSLIIRDYTDPAGSFDAVRITPQGIDAASVTFGSARGGHNLVANSSFEMGAFVALPVTVNTTWGVAADWNTTRQGTDTNVTTNAGSLSMAAVT